MIWEEMSKYCLRNEFILMEEYVTSMKSNFFSVLALNIWKYFFEILHLMLNITNLQIYRNQSITSYVCLYNSNR